MTPCLFVSDLHGHLDRYEKLFRVIRAERPAAVFLGGDLLPGAVAALFSGRGDAEWRVEADGEPAGADQRGKADRRPAEVGGEAAEAGGEAAEAGGKPATADADTTAGGHHADSDGGEPPRHAEGDFLSGFLARRLERIRAGLGAAYPEIFLILGNDDGKAGEEAVLEGEARGLWHYAHARCHSLGRYSVYGYACIPPTPFMLKDWERYDVSRHLDPGACAPEDGWLSVEVPADELRHGTIQKDLAALCGEADLARSIFLFHAPPYDCCLDRAGLDGLYIEHVPFDVHVGSIAIRRLLEARGPLISLHGHVHEAARLTGSWRERIGCTHAFTAAHDGPELALVRFAPERPEDATRELL